CAATAARSSAGPWSHPLGNPAHRCTAQRAHRHYGWHHSGTWPRPWRNHRRHHGDWQFAADFKIPVRPRIHTRQRHCQRIHRGNRKSLFERIDGNWIGALHHHSYRQRSRPASGMERDARYASEGHWITKLKYGRSASVGDWQMARQPWEWPALRCWWLRRWSSSSVTSFIRASALLTGAS